MTETLISLRNVYERWLDSRDYFRTGPGLIMGVTDVLFYLAFAFCFGWDFLGTTMFKTLYTDALKDRMEGVYFFALFMAALCGIVAMVLRFRAHLVVINVILVASGYIQWAEGGKKLFLLALCVMIAGSSDRSFRVISYIALIEGAVIMAAAFFASQMDIITDLVYEGGRHSFGIVYCTDCAAHIFFLMGVYAMLRLDSFGLIDYLVFVFLLTFMMMTRAKTDIACSILLLAGIAVCRLTARINWKNIRWGNALKGIGRAVGAFLCFSFMICAALSFGLSLLQDLTDPITRRRIYTIDYTLLRRMELNRDALLAHPFTLFGTKIRQKGFGGKTEGLPDWDEYNFIDCSYVRIYVLGGVILFVLLLVILTYVMLRCYKNRRYFFIFILSIVALVSMIEHHLPEYYYNLFPMMAFTGGGIYRRKILAAADSRSKPDLGKKGKKGKKKRNNSEVNLPAFLLTGLIALLFSTCTAYASDADTINIPDPVLKKAVLEALDLSGDEITSADAARLTELIYDGNEQEEQIGDLTGLSAFTSLKKLDVHGNSDIRDLTPLQGLDSLESLDVHGDILISDLEPLAGLKNLRELNLEKTYGIRDISALRGLTGLENLNLRQDYQIEDLGPVKEMIGLKSLDLSYMQMDDLEWLRAFSDLTVLELEGNRIEDTAPLQGLSDLEELNLYDNRIREIAPLEGLTKIEKLNLGYNQIDSISALEEMDRMTELCLCGNKIRDISPLQKMEGLRILNLDGNAVDSISVLENMKDMEELTVTDSGITDLSPLRNMTGMRKLELRGNRIKNISALSGMTEMVYLGLAENRISNISALSGMTKITRMEMWDNQIANISPLRGMTAMTHIEINDNRIKDISALQNMEKLDYLEIDNNRIKDLSPLAKTTRVRTLFLSNNRIRDVSPLRGLERLFWVELSGNEVSDFSPLQGKESLEYLGTGE